MLQDDIKKYIDVERELSKYQLDILLKIKNPSHAQKRLIQIEEEFLSLPFYDMSFEDVSDVATAIAIYKTSRLEFYKSYDVKDLDDKKKNLLKEVSKKFIFVRNISKEQMLIKPQEVNLVQNSEFYYELLNRESIRNETTIALEKKRLDVFTLDELNDIEPVILSKKRARLQAIHYSIGKHLRVEIDKISLSDDLTYLELLEKNQAIDFIISNIPNNIYKYYNEALNILNIKLKDTMGKNSSILKIHYIQNVLDGDLKQPILNKEHPSGNFLLVNFTKEKNIELLMNKNKSFGMLLPIPHVGNEKLSLLHKEIILNGYDISHLFLNNFVNIKAIKSGKESYFKSVVLKPLSVIKDSNENDFNLIASELSKNNMSYFNIAKESYIYAAQTRSEEESLLELNNFINFRISEIKQDYENCLNEDY